MSKRIIAGLTIMVLTVSQVLFSFPFNFSEVREADAATTRVVNNSSELQSALNAAQPGDEIVLNNGTYTGQFTINGANGTAAAPITIRAANKHQAVFVGAGLCGNTQVTFTVQRSYWVIRDLKFRDFWAAIYVHANNVEIANSVFDHYGEAGIRVDGF
jgi:hypothetical protein